jgi:RNA polymerase sigma-70 factor (ECF subfamily)
MLNYFLRATGERALSEELFQELFLRVFDGRARYEARRPFRVWLYTLARNLLRDRWRQLGRRPSWDGTDAERGRASVDPETACSAQQQLGQLRDAVLGLPPLLREVLILSRFDGLSFAEIGEIVDCSEGAARVRLFRALERLRHAMPAEIAPARAAGGSRR